MFSNIPTNLCMALYYILLCCFVLYCIVLLIYCLVDIIQYNPMHKYVGVLDNPFKKSSNDELHVSNGTTSSSYVELLLSSQGRTMTKMVYTLGPKSCDLKTRKQSVIGKLLHANLSCLQCKKMVKVPFTFNW